MGLDIRLPIGLMFLIMGLLLVGYGLLTNGNAELYERSLSVNINLWWGLAMSTFGLLMLIFSQRQEKEAGLSKEGIATEERERRLGLEQD
jgi:hypothetical protein